MSERDDRAVLVRGDLREIEERLGKVEDQVDRLSDDMVSAATDILALRKAESRLDRIGRIVLGDDRTPTDSAVPEPEEDPERKYPCDRCGTLRTKAEGGTTFTVCDGCWETIHGEPAPEETAGMPEPVAWRGRDRADGVWKYRSEPPRATDWPEGENLYSEPTVRALYRRLEAMREYARKWEQSADEEEKRAERAERERDDNHARAEEIIRTREKRIRELEEDATQTRFERNDAYAHIRTLEERVGRAHHELHESAFARKEAARRPQVTADMVPSRMGGHDFSATDRAIIAGKITAALNDHMTPEAGEREVRESAENLNSAGVSEGPAPDLKHAFVAPNPTYCAVCGLDRQSHGEPLRKGRPGQILAGGRWIDPEPEGAPAPERDTPTFTDALQWRQETMAIIDPSSHAPRPSHRETAARLIALLDDRAAARSSAPSEESVQGVTRYNEDDEVVGRGHFHLERMNDGHLWLNLGGQAFDLEAAGRITIMPQAPVTITRRTPEATDE